MPWFCVKPLVDFVHVCQVIDREGQAALPFYA
jgi:hypothetical protein